MENVYVNLDMVSLQADRVSTVTPLVLSYRMVTVWYAPMEKCGMETVVYVQLAKLKSKECVRVHAANTNSLMLRETVTVAKSTRKSVEMPVSVLADM